MHFAAIPFLAPISEFLGKGLQYFNTFTGNFGVNVILLTVAFRIVVLPLSIKQTASMIAMQKLQPQLKEIQKKHKDDREKQGQEMMKLYKENKASPLGGCLPLILQMPILFALFEVLREVPKYVRYKTSFSFLGINNLIATGETMWAGGTIKEYSLAAHKVVTVKVPGQEYFAVFALILLTIGTGYVASKMMTNDPKQAKMMAFMPVIFGVFAWILPAGVTIYIVITNVLMILQQYIQLEAEGFYDEQRVTRMKTGKPLKWNESALFRFYEYGSTVLTAVKIKKPPAPAAKKQVPKKEANGNASDSAGKTKATGAKSAVKPATDAKKSAQKAGQETEDRKTVARESAKKPARPSPYPAKKKGAGKKRKK